MKKSAKYFTSFYNSVNFVFEKKNYKSMQRKRN